MQFSQVWLNVISTKNYIDINYYKKKLELIFIFTAKERKFSFVKSQCH